MKSLAGFDFDLARRRGRSRISAAVALTVAALVLSGCAAAPGTGTGTNGATGAAPSPTGAAPRSLAWRGSGDQVFFLNPDGEALDKALYTVRLGNDSAEVYAIATAGDDKANPQVEIVDIASAAARRLRTSALPPSALPRQPRPPSAPAPELAWVTYLDNHPPPLLRGSVSRLRNAPSRPQRAVVRGSHETFRELGGAGNLNPIPATARAVVTDRAMTVAVWVADREWACAARQCLTQPIVDAVATRFLRPGPANDIYDWITAIFGAPWGPHQYSNLIPPRAANEIHILLYDINGDGIPRVGEPRVVGYYSIAHNYLRNDDLPALQSSNERLMFFVDSPFLSLNQRETISTLAHEFQHMIHFYQKAVVRDADRETWLNEMASEVAEDLIADKLGGDGPRAVAYDDATAGDPGNISGRLPEYNLFNYIQVTAWQGTLANYSINYALGAYLARNYGGAELFGRIVRSKLAGVEAVEGALRDMGHQVSFPQMLANWAAANLLSDNTEVPVPYRYNSGTWSTSRAADGTTFRLGSINLYHYVHRGYPDRPGPYLRDLIAFNARTQPPHSNMYTTLGRITGSLRLRVSAPAGSRVTVVVKE